MRFDAGDVVFSQAGKPGVVTGRDPVSGRISVDIKGKKLEEAKNRGFVNGLKTTERQAFNKIIDEARQVKDPVERIAEFQLKIDELKDDPKNYRLVRYLKAEIAHTMYSERITPKSYTADEANL